MELIATNQFFSAIEAIPFIRGYIDLIEIQERQRAHVRGWIFRPDVVAETVDISLNGTPWVSDLHLFDRPDVAAHFRSTLGSSPGLLRCGFDATARLLPDGELRNGDIIGVALYAQNARCLGIWQSYHARYPDQEPVLADPPEHLRERVGGSQDFDAVGVQAASLIMTCVGKHKSMPEAHAILDWGCGCGRVIRQMMKFVSPNRLFGCDIDSEAIRWSQKNINGPAFSCVGPYPPTPYRSGTFDVVYGISVMTHLDERTQLLWLEELARITRSDAILALSIIGEELRRTNMPPFLAAEFQSRGFAAFVPHYSAMLAPFSDEHYYKEAYHSLEYIARTWGRFFHVLECLETKHQDIVILKAK